MKFGYNLYGVKANSELKLLDFPHRNVYKNPDVIIGQGKLSYPDKNIPDTVYLPFCAYNKEFYYLDILGIAKFKIIGKERVIIDFYSRANVTAAFVYFLDTIVSVLLLRYNIFPILGSSVRLKNGKVVIFSSKFGEGKSAIAANFCCRGHKLISDNFTVLKWDEKQDSFVTRSFTHNIDLWGDVLIKIVKMKPELSLKRRIRKDLGKFRVDFTKVASKQYSKVNQIYVIKVVNDIVEFSPLEISGVKKIEKIKNIIYPSSLCDTFSDRSSLFQFQTKIAKNINVKVVSRSRIDKLAQFVENIENEISRESIKG